MPYKDDMDKQSEVDDRQKIEARSRASEEAARRRGCPERLRLDEIARTEFGLELDQERNRATTETPQRMVTTAHTYDEWETVIAQSLAYEEAARRRGCPERLELDEIARTEFGLELDRERNKVTMETPQAMVTTAHSHDEREQKVA